MPITTIRGPKLREQIVQRYHLRPLCHTAILPGRYKQGLTGVLVDRYYSFEYTNREDKKDNAVFFCGYSCGEHLMDLLGRPHLKLFNPLTRLPSLSDSSGSNTDGSRPTVKAHPLNEELYKAINLLFFFLNRPPRGGVADTLDFLRTYPTYRAKFWRIENFNRYIATTFKSTGRTLSEEAAMTNGVKPFSFPLIAAALAAEGQPDHYNLR